MALREEIVQQVWEHARVAAGQDPALWRVDECGAWINRLHYGRQDSEFGWKIENTSAGGPDTMENLRAFNVGNGFDRSQGQARCRVVADRSGQSPWEQASGPHNKGVGGHKT
ncbi:MAG: hypothetical protein ACOZCP_10050 [Pseudomonadota bacterium]